MGFFDTLFGPGYYDSQMASIRNATTPDELTKAYTPPGAWDRMMLTAQRLNTGDLDTARQNKLDELYKNEAATIAGDANRLKLMALSDPQGIGTPEGLRDFVSRPAYWLGQNDTTTPGVISGAKGSKPVTTRSANPYTAAVITQFAQDAQNQADLYAAMKGDPESAARLASQKDLPQQFHQATQGLEQLSNVNKHNQDIAAASKSAADLAQFQQTISALNGGTTRPTDPNLGPVYQQPVETDPGGQTYVRTDTGGLMPYEELSARVQQAYADNPGVPREVVKNLMDDFRLQYTNSGKTSQGKIGRTTYQKFDPALGHPVITKEDVQPAPPRISINNGTSGTTSQIESWVNQLRAGNVVLSEIPARGNIRTQVVDYLTKNHPEVDLTKIKANKNWIQSSATGNTLALIQATNGVMEDMVTAYKDLGRSKSPTWNWLQDKWQMFTGDDTRTNYMTLKNYGVQEVEKVLSGSGAMSDHRIKLAFDSWKDSNTPKQADSALKALKKVLSERDSAVRSGPYPGVTTPVPQSGTAPSGGTWRLK